MPPLPISLAQRAATPIAIVRRQVASAELGAAVQAACGAVWAELRAQGIRGGRNIALYRDTLITLEAGVELEGAFLERGGVTRSATPEGLVASIKHFGPYGTLRVAHDAIHTWARNSGHRLVGPRWEFYGHWQTAWDADPSKIETEVAYLVEPA